MPRHVSLLLLFDEHKRILLQHRSEDAKRLPGHWAFFGGGIEPGETPEQTLMRESQEELHYKPQNPKKMMVQTYTYQGEENHKHIFMEPIEHAQTLRQDEGQGMGWFTPQEARALKMIGHDRDTLETLDGKY